MKAALLIVLSLSALAFAGPAYNKNNNQIDAANKAATSNNNQQQYATDAKQSQAVESLKQWCFSSQMSQPELTASFKKLVSIVKASPGDPATEAAVTSERICQGAIVEKSSQSGETYGQSGPDAKAHELIKDVYMDALIACKSRQCTQQLIKVIESNQVDAIRAAYYMTRIAVTEQDEIEQDEGQVKQLAEMFDAGNAAAGSSEAIERQKLFATTALIGKALKAKPESAELKQSADKTCKTIVERYIKPVSQQEVQQYQQQEQPSSQLAKKIAKREAALKALANIPGHALKQIAGVEQTLVSIATDKQELSTSRQSAIECLEENENAVASLKQVTFDQEEPTEVRVAALRAIMTSSATTGSAATTTAAQIIAETVKHCEQARNQQEDEQFVLYAISHLDNLRSSQQPEHEAVKEAIAKNKQHYMQIQVLSKKFKQQLNDVRRSSRNYKLEQEFNQLESGLIIEGDIIYESKNKQQQQPGIQVLPKLVRVNMSMPVMGETVNVVEVTIRQDDMDEEVLSALKLIQANNKITTESVSKVVDSFSKQQRTGSAGQKSATAQADLTIKVDGATIVYLSLDDIKSASSQSSQQHQRSTRSAYSTYSIVDEIIEHLKRKPVAFNRGFNFNLNERIAKLVDVEANLIAGLRFESRASGKSSDDFEISAQVEPRFGFEAIVGPAKVSDKKILQRVSTKTALGVRLRFKKDELVDVQVELPMNTMELFTVETQMVERSSSGSSSFTSYNYLPESIYGQEDIYSPEDIYASQWSSANNYDNYDDDDTTTTNNGGYSRAIRKVKRSIFAESKKSSSSKSIMQYLKGDKGVAHSFETSEKVARAVGLRGKLRVVASPKDMSFLVQAVAQKYEPGMQGYRFQVQKVQRSGDAQQFIVAVSTPGSRQDRSMQVRVLKVSNSQRTSIKSDIQSAQLSASSIVELVHDGRVFAIKTELASTTAKTSGRKQFRHALEAGVQRGSQSQSGRIATTYKPYLTIDSTYLRRPVQLQGQLSYQQSPKTVISYELKSSTSPTTDYIQGKIILDQRQSQVGGRVSRHYRSMSSPIEVLASSDVTLTGEIIGQLGQHAIKAHQMIDWDSKKYAVASEMSAIHKSLRKGTESQVSASLKVDENQQQVSVQRKSGQDERKDFRMTLNSVTRSPGSQQLVAEIRYNGRRNSMIAYKHKLDMQQVSSNKIDVSVQAELIDTERQIDEKLSGQARASFERKMKSAEVEMSSRGKSAKAKVEYVSPSQHQIMVAYQGEQVSHKSEVRSDQRQYTVSSRTDKHGQTIGKVSMELNKDTDELQVMVDAPTKQSSAALKLELTSGKQSSFAVQTPRFASKAEFVFETSATKSRPFAGKRLATYYLPSNTNLRFKSDLKDLMKKEAYWMESAWSSDPANKSYFRFDSPQYRTDLEFEPSQQVAKFGSYARNKRSTGPNYNSIYSDKDSSSIFGELSGSGAADKLKLGANKLWMVRSVLSSPSKVEQVKREARRALFQFADRRQHHQHQLTWAPAEQRLKYAFEHEPNTEFAAHDAFRPTLFSADLDTDLYSATSGRSPSRVSLQSQWMDVDVAGKPFDGAESYASVSAISRHPRSAFNKHESEIRYKKGQGYKGWMKHQDKKEGRHSFQVEADESPKKWAKMSFDSDKYGKADYEHQWRKHLTKRSASPMHLAKLANNNNNNNNDDDDDDDNQDYYLNNIRFGRESARGPAAWSQRSSFEWLEPAAGAHMFRVRRDLDSYLSGEPQRRYNTIEYLKHVNARLSSEANKNQAQLYKLDFDYQPQQAKAMRLNLQMPDDMLHESSLELKPSERMYKIQSKLYNQRTSQPSYQLQLATKPMTSGLASADQEPVFFNDQHPMLAGYSASPYLSGMAQLFKQPLKLDYSDKYGRQARFDFDQSPLAGPTLYQGLRRKRAALYYKDESADFEHDSTFHFHPEAAFASPKQWKKYRSAGQTGSDLYAKSSTKYGPVELRVDSDDKTLDVELKSAVVSAKLSAETSRQSGAKLIKLAASNKQQSVQLAKIVRKSPILNEIDMLRELAAAIDSARYEHETELLWIDSSNKKLVVKSQTLKNSRPAVWVEAELDDKQAKGTFKLEEARAVAHLAVDMVSKSAKLALDVDNKRTLEHQTRLTRATNNFYALDSTTTYNQKPLAKISAKISAFIIENPGHLFNHRRYSGSSDDHMTIFETVIYEPKEYYINGHFDCHKMEGHVQVMIPDQNKVQNTIVKYDQATETIIVDARLQASYGQVYATQAKLNLPGIKQSGKCNYSHPSCQSEIAYTDNSGQHWSTKFLPGQYVTFNTPTIKQTLNMVY